MPLRVSQASTGLSTKVLELGVVVAVHLLVNLEITLFVALMRTVYRSMLDTPAITPFNSQFFILTCTAFMYKSVAPKETVSTAVRVIHVELQEHH